MRKISLLTLTVLLAFVFASCQDPTNPPDVDSDNTDTVETTDTSSTKHAPVVSFPQGDYEVSGAETTAANGFYEENGTLNAHVLYTQISGEQYNIYNAYYSGNSAPLPASGNFWCVDLDETTASLGDVEFWSYSNDPLSIDLEWYTQSGEESAMVLSPAVVFSGSTDLYETITINYIFTDSDGDAEGITNFRWFRYDPDVVDDPGTLISEAAGASYATTVDDDGMYLKVEITPVDATFTAGKPVLSESSGIIGASAG